MSELDLIASENKLTNFRKKHPMSLDTPELQLQRLRLIREVEVNQEVFITLRNQLEDPSADDANRDLLRRRRRGAAQRRRDSPRWPARRITR